MSKQQPAWRKAPTAKDYDGALNFLSLLARAKDARRIVNALRRAATVEHAAKDLLRASGLPLLPRDEPHVDDDLQKIRKGKALPPVLLVRGELARATPLTVADGYHRICAICYFDENAPVPCRIVGG
ncbi:MAG TPA: hypothetical protein VNU97_00230 [Rhizomicrobium sp.]|jgi:hypothetical protein|nr:hypothetical protein [Rhizomicrobium sp.]